MNDRNATGHGHNEIARTKRVGVVGIERHWPDPSSIEFNKLYQGIGKNSGNLMFTEAVFTLIDADLRHIGFSFDPAWVNQNFDAVVIPAANWLNNYANWDWLIDQLMELRVPVTVTGLGLQSSNNDLDSVQVNASCRRLIEFFASQPSPISVRGNFTRDWLISIGVNHVVTTGCPSIYMNIFPQSTAPKDGKLVFQGTRYGMTDAFLKSNGINRQMFSFSSKFDCPMIYQSEPEEIELLTGGLSVADLGAEKSSLLTHLYGCKTISDLDRFLAKNGKVFFDLRSWSAFLADFSAVIGTRLHGSIIALSTGRPAVIVPHDSRTAEVASFAGMQAIQGPIARDCSTIEELESLISSKNLERYRDVRSKNQEVFVHFLKSSGFRPKYDSLF